MANEIYIPFLNPVKFYDKDRVNLEKYFTKHFDSFMFSERGYVWEQRADYCQIWQTTDIIRLQFESTFDPIIVKLINKDELAVITLPALIGLPNKFIPNTFSFEVEISLGEVAKGCYYLQIEAGSGENKKTLVSDCLHIYDTQIKNSLCLEYWNTRSKDDVLFETGIKFQYRLFGSFGRLQPGRKDEMTKDQKYNPAILSNINFRQWPIWFGDQFGLPDDVIDLLNRIWGCDNVLIDNKPFCVSDGGKFEFIEVEKYQKRGAKLTVEEGINRNSSIFSVETDTSKKLSSTIIVDAKVFGDLANQGSSNAVPVINIE